VRTLREDEAAIAAEPKAGPAGGTPA